MDHHVGFFKVIFGIVSRYWKYIKSWSNLPKRVAEIESGAYPNNDVSSRGPHYCGACRRVQVYVRSEPFTKKEFNHEYKRMVDEPVVHEEWLVFVCNNSKCIYRKEFYVHHKNYK